MDNLKNRSILKIIDFKQKEIQFLLDLSADLKKAKYSKTEVKQLVGKNIALIFEKDSTRTRCAFEVAAYDQGAHVTYLASGNQMNSKESVKDTARVLGRMYDAIEYRGFAQQSVEYLAKYSGVPVYNGLTDDAHPSQILADFLTIIEHKGSLAKTKLVYCGDGRNNMANSLLAGAAIMGMDFRICSPKSLFPEPKLVAVIKKIASESKAKITITDSIEEAVTGADAVYTDVWVSMGENNWEDRIKLLKAYQVNKKLMNLADKNAIFLHCLPAFHDTNTIIGKELQAKYGLDSLEVTNEVFESKASVVFDEAENRMHTIKAMLVATLASKL